MNRLKKSFAAALALAMLASLCSCTETGNHSGHVNKNPDPSKPMYSEPDTTETDIGVTDTPPPTPTASPYSDYYEFTFFGAYVGNEKSSDNDIRELIAEKTSVMVYESWLTGQVAQEAIGSIIASGNLPDFIDGAEHNVDLYENNCLIAWDDYLELYPDLKALYTDEEWDRFRMPDGHIYWANVFDNFYEKDTTTIHNASAFWIQARVLEWAGYPKIETLDEYFDLLERYADANPEMPDGSSVIPYTCICEDWRIFGLESAPIYLDGYPYDGCVIVNVDACEDNPIVVDYNTTATARDYFRKLNEEYEKGYMDPDFSIQTYDEYTAKICSGRVLGMFDQYWDFYYNYSWVCNDTLYGIDDSKYTLSGIGCDYVPLGLVAENGMDQQYHTYGGETNYVSGIAVTTNCIDPDVAFRFLNNLLSQEIHDLRFWGIEGEDYFVDSSGQYYRTDEMRAAWNDTGYLVDHSCEYSYFPQWRGMSEDGINRRMPEEQPSEFQAALPDSLVKCFEAYGATNYVEFLGSVESETYPWYPLWSWSNALDFSSSEGEVFGRMTECKHEWLPKVVINSNFDSTWEEYMSNYEDCNPEVFLEAAQQEVYRRLDN